jgi:hypothetical protein
VTDDKTTTTWTAPLLSVDENSPLEVDHVLTDAEEQEVEDWLKS